MQTLWKWILIPSNILAVIAGALISIMMVHVTADILGKKLFQAPVEGTIEFVAAYYMVAIIFLPLAYVSRGEGHIKVDLFTRKMTPRNLAKLETVIGICTTLYLVALVWFSSVTAVAKTKIGEDIETAADYLPIWPSRWFVPIGAGVMLLFVLHRLWLDFRHAATGEEPPPEFDDYDIRDAGESSDG